MCIVIRKVELIREHDHWHFQFDELNENRRQNNIPWSEIKWMLLGFALFLAIGLLQKANDGHEHTLSGEEMGQIQLERKEVQRELEQTRDQLSSVLRQVKTLRRMRDSLASRSNDLKRKLIYKRAQGGRRCFSVKGILLCHANKARAMDTRIDLMDDDGALNPDDQVGFTISNDDGSFKVEGCGYDFMTDPDPYLKIFNACNGDTINTRINLPYIFSPDVIDAGEIVLDL